VQSSTRKPKEKALLYTPGRMSEGGGSPRTSKIILSKVKTPKNIKISNKQFNIVESTFSRVFIFYLLAIEIMNLK